MCVMDSIVIRVYLIQDKWNQLVKLIFECEYITSYVIKRKKFFQIDQAHMILRYHMRIRYAFRRIIEILYMSDKVCF